MVTAEPIPDGRFCGPPTVGRIPLPPVFFGPEAGMIIVGSVPFSANPRSRLETPWPSPAARTTRSTWALVSWIEISVSLTAPGKLAPSRSARPVQAPTVIISARPAPGKRKVNYLSFEKAPGRVRRAPRSSRGAR